MSQLLPGTEVIARGLRWEVVGSESLGPQTLYRLRGLEGVVLGHEFDLLHDLEQIQPVVHEISPDKAGPLPNWLVYHQAFLLEQSLGPSALLAVQPGRLRIEPYQLVPVLRAIRMSRVRVPSHVSLVLLRATPIPDLESSCTLISHNALRLTCNHAGYAPLWREQMGDVWREPETPPSTWPVLAGDDRRWAVRAAIDAVVADAYGLSRDQYAHVLSTFSHASYRKAPELCLACFDELKQIGLEAFTRKHDPYWDILLNESLPQPVIDLPLPTDAERATAEESAEPLLTLAAEGEDDYRLVAKPKTQPKTPRRRKR